MKLVRIHVCQSLPEAAVLATVLRAADVPAFFQGAHHANVAWHHIFALGGIPILVPTQEVDKAQNLISNWPGPNLPLRESFECAKAPIRNGLIAGLVFVFLGAIFPFWVRNRKYEKLK